MNRIESRFAALREKNETAFIPYIVAGDPTLALTKEYVLALDAAGAEESAGTQDAARGFDQLVIETRPWR